MNPSSMNSRPARGADEPLRQLQRLRRREKRFEDSLAALEAEFAATAGGADSASWIERAAAAFDTLRPALQQARAQHRGALDQIAEEDLGLQPRIDEMRAAEGLLEQKQGELEYQFTALRQRLASGDTDHAALGADIARIATEGLDWVSRVRAQDLAVHTWLTEALTRDRGVVD
jgi:hypothetical protein